MFGLMRKSTHHYLYEKQGERYRWEITEQKNEINHLKSHLRNFSDIIIHDVHMDKQMIPHDRLVLVVEVSAERLRQMLPNDLVGYLRDRIMERLLEFNKDYRPDMRQQVKNERLFIR